MRTQHAYAQYKQKKNHFLGVHMLGLHVVGLASSSSSSSRLSFGDHKTYGDASHGDTAVLGHVDVELILHAANLSKEQYILERKSTAKKLRKRCQYMYRYR